LYSLTFMSRPYFAAALVLVFMMKFCSLAIIPGGLRQGAHGARLCAVVFLPVIAYCLSPMPRVHIFELKHVIFFVPLSILAAAAWFGDTGRLQWARRSLGVLLVLGNLYFTCVYLSPWFEKEPWREVIAKIDRAGRRGDLLMVNPEYAQAPYYIYGRRNLPIAGPPVRFGRMMSRGLSPNIRRVWLVDVRSPVARPAPEPGRWLETNWTLVRLASVTREYHGALGSIRVRLFRRPETSTHAPPRAPLDF